VLFRSRILSLLDRVDLIALLPDMTEVSWSAGQVLYEVGGQVTHAHFPSTAGLSVVTVMSDDAAVECATVGYESAVGVLAALSGQISTNRTFVQLAGSGISVDATALRRRAAQSPPLLDLLLRAVQTLIAQEEQSVACNALHETAPRLARWLLVCQDRLDTTQMMITQEYLANMLGVQRTAVNAAAGALRSEGLIRYSRGQVEILDHAALQARACECYGAVNHMYDRLLAAPGETSLPRDGVGPRP
jgi:CRP-like cAMP-binding protein